MKKTQNLSLIALRKFAADLASKLSSKDHIIGLTGDLGSGKTTFAKAFAKSLGVKHKVKSPTFIISMRYPLKGRRGLYHFDFYRLTSRRQLESVGFEEILSQKNRLVLIEWIDKFPSLAKKCDLIINFKISGPNTRHVTIA
jgi:tRNA threonylcarbamoyladenosine biosynthesis protein TsaE